MEHWIYQNAEYFKIWFEMIYRARYGIEPATQMIEGQLVTINRGEFIFGRKSWSNRLGVGEQVLRTLIKKLTKDNMIELVKQYNKFTIYKIINYEIYNQQSNQQYVLENQYSEGYSNQLNNHQVTISQPPANHQLTTKEESNKDNKDNKDIYILTDEENRFLNVLNIIPNYPLNRDKDLEMYKSLSERYPELDLVEAIEKWRIYKLDKPLDSKSNARSQINTSFKNYVKWGKCLKEGKDEHFTGNGESNTWDIEHLITRVE